MVIRLSQILMEGAVGFVLLGLLILWFHRPHRGASAANIPGSKPRTSWRDNQRSFDWQTALVFLISAIAFDWLGRVLAHFDFMSGWWRGVVPRGTSIAFAILGLAQGLWLKYKRSGPGLTWLVITVFGGVYVGYCYGFAPSVLLLNGFQFQFLVAWAFFCVAIPKTWLLSRYYRGSWLLIFSLLLVHMLSVGLASFTAEGSPARLVWNYVILIPSSVVMGIIIARPKQPGPEVAPPRGAGEGPAGFVAAVQSLKGCRPLEDPIRTVRNIIGKCGLLFFPMAFLISEGIGTLEGRDARSLEAAIPILLPAAGLFVIGLITVLLTPRSATSPNAFIVRAFRRDEEMSRLRDLISLALGPQGRLLGIRDPRQRFGLFTRLFAFIEGAFRYLGSNYCDLEGADRNWLARVLATLYLREIDFVVIDLRETTAAVTVEVKVVAQAMTPLRVIWLMDDTQTEEEWRQNIHLLTDGGVDADAPVHLLNVREVDQPQSGGVVAMVSAVLDEATQPQHLGEWQQALVQAQTLARTHVSEADWNTPWFETLAGGFWICTVVVALLDGLLLWLNQGRIGDALVILLAIIGLVVLVRTVISAVAAIRRKCQLRRMGRELAAERGW